MVFLEEEKTGLNFTREFISVKVHKIFFVVCFFKQQCKRCHLSGNLLLWHLDRRNKIVNRVIGKHFLFPKPL